MIRSRRSRIPKNSFERSETIRKALYSETDNDFIDFIEVSEVKFEFLVFDVCLCYWD